MMTETSFLSSGLNKIKIEKRGRNVYLDQRMESQEESARRYLIQFGNAASTC